MKRNIEPEWVKGRVFKSKRVKVIEATELKFVPLEKFKLSQRGDENVV